MSPSEPARACPRPPSSRRQPKDLITPVPFSRLPPGASFALYCCAEGLGLGGSDMIAVVRALSGD